MPNFPAVVMPTVRPTDVLRGQKALVTGGDSGIGAAIAIAMCHAGADVVINYNKAADKAAAVAKLAMTPADDGHNPGKAIVVQADVSQEDQVLGMFKQMFDAFGTIDVLVSNSGMQQDSPLEAMTLEQWNRVIGVNLTGQFLCCREAVKEFKKRGVKSEVSCAAGKIICMSSVHEVIPWAGHVNYAASKGGIMMMMKSIAQEVAPYRVRVNAIGPGAIRTPINKEAWSTPEAYTDLMRLVPYKRIGEPEDIGRAAVWLASDAADYVTGITLFVDGGMTLYPGFEAGG